MVFVVIAKVVGKIVMKLLIDKKIGILNPLSIVGIWFTLPFALTLLTIYNSNFSQMANKIMGFDIKNPNVLKSDEDRMEILTVFISYCILVQVLYAPFVMGDKQKFPFKITTIKKSDIPMIIFGIISSTIIPRSVSLFLKNNVSFQTPEHSAVAASLAYLTTNIGIQILDELWNPFSFVLSSILSILTIKINDSNLKLPYYYIENKRIKIGLVRVRTVIKYILGLEYPSNTNKTDDMVLTVFLMFFWLVIISGFVSNIPFIQNFVANDSFIKTLINVCTMTILPLYFKNVSYGTKYSSEMIFMGSLIGVVSSTLI